MRNQLVAFAASLLCSVFASAVPDAGNLILHVGGKDRDLVLAQILAAGETVANDGRLVLAFASPGRSVHAEQKWDQLGFELNEVLADLPSSLKDKILLVDSNEAYTWERDSAAGWIRSGDGRARLQGNVGGNSIYGPKEKGVYSSMGISTLLMACEGSVLDFPALKNVSHQGGMVVSNGQGTCVVNSDAVRSKKGELNPVAVTDIGCADIVEGPSTQSWIGQKHNNGHIDLSASFVGPRTVMVPKFSAECRTSFQTGWDDLKKSIAEKGMDVVEVPVGGGCHEMVKDKSVIASYSNAVVLRDTIMIPQFIGDTAAESARFDRDNRQAIAILQEQMDAGKIPRRRIVGFPVPRDWVNGGGEVRCATYEVPGQLGRCTQERLNQAIENELQRAHAAGACLGEGVEREVCTLSKQVYETVRFLHEEPTRERVMRTPEGETISVLNKYRDALGEAAQKLRTKLEASCAWLWGG